MQTPSGYPTAHPFYPNLYHLPPPGPQDHELKKQYLALLPPQQIIDICLNFDLHVPPYVKSTVWPADINAAIAAIRKAATPSRAGSTEPEAPAPPVMASLNKPSDASIEQPKEVQPPGKPCPIPDSAQSSAQVSEQIPSTSQSPLPQQPPYPHQRYGYTSQAAYPHTPYYQPPGYPSYPSPYPYLPQISPTYVQSSGHHQQQGFPYSDPPPTHAPPPPPPDSFPQTNDDLPSYEEMIVEALLDSNDTEGCAPKDLFTWMAARYPLQSNFRPSASQALQKAFKRGRFEKSSNGKYRLNAAWEGGSTSKRTTRRPQTQNPTSNQQPATSPFTHAPLVHQSAHGYQPQTYGFPYQKAQPGYPGFVQPTLGQHQVQPPPQVDNTPISANDSTRPPAATNASHDAWEAAENILKAINFNSLLQLPKEGEKADGQENRTGNSTVSTAGAPAVHQTPTSSGADALPGMTTKDTSIGTESPGLSAKRAELQAHLALLAAQLAELSQEGDDNSVVQYPVINAATVESSVHVAISADVSLHAVTGVSSESVPSVISTADGGTTSVVQSSGPTALTEKSPLNLVVAEEEESSEVDDDMEEVI